MKVDINNFVHFVRLKNGSIRIKHDIHNEKNIYKYLYDIGFRKGKIGNKRIYFRRKNDEIYPVNMLDIREAFKEFLYKGDYTNCPEGVSHLQIINWFYLNKPIKENNLFYKYMNEIINEKDIHLLKLKIDPIYRHKYLINQLIERLSEWGFSKTLGNIGGNNRNTQPLYYKKLRKGKFLVFNHWNADSKYIDGFDCWIINYSSEKHIGKKDPLDLKDIRMGFDLNRDFYLIEQFLI